MMSYNLNNNVGFITARDSDVIAHERTAHWYNPDGIVCAVHGGSGNLNNYLFDNIRIESPQWALLSINILNNPWGSAAELGSISTILLRNIDSAMPFSSPDAFHISGNRTKNARIDTVVFEGIRIAGRALTRADVQSGVGTYVTNVSVCAEGCGDRIVPSGVVPQAWTKAQICGRTPQPFINGRQLPPLAFPDIKPYCT